MGSVAFNGHDPGALATAWLRTMGSRRVLEWKYIGRIGFFYPEGWPGFELGWVLGREFWGKGYASEGARRALEYGFAEMGRDHVISLIHPDNSPSIKVAERLGEGIEGETELFGHTVLIYGVSR